MILATISFVNSRPCDSEDTLAPIQQYEQSLDPYINNANYNDILHNIDQHLVNFQGQMGMLQGDLISTHIVPDVINSMPRNKLTVLYSTGALVEFGNELGIDDVVDLPNFKWPARKGSLYSLLMIDPDVPSSVNRSLSEILHFMATNIPGTDLTKANIDVEYVGSQPTQGSGLHRYVFLVFEQRNGKINSTMPKILKTAIEGRTKFSSRQWAQQNNLGEPIAVNFFTARAVALPATSKQGHDHANIPTTNERSLIDFKELEQGQLSSISTNTSSSSSSSSSTSSSTSSLSSTTPSSLLTSTERPTNFTEVELLNPEQGV